MRIRVSRWPMCGGGLAYSVRVPVEEAPAFLRERTPAGSNSYVTVIIDDGREFFEFAAATVSEAHHDAEPGISKYRAWQQHEKSAHAAALRILQSVFPETRQLTEYPTLWVSGLMSRDEEERNAKRDVWVDGVGIEHDELQSGLVAG